MSADAAMHLSTCCRFIEAEVFGADDYVLAFVKSFFDSVVAIGCSGIVFEIVDAFVPQIVIDPVGEFIGAKSVFIVGPVYYAIVGFGILDQLVTL